MNLATIAERVGGEESLKTLLVKNYLIDAELCRRSMFYFMREFWSEIVTDEPKWNWHIEYLCNELEQVAYRVARKEPSESDLIINLPPGETKSLICSIFFPAWCWLNWYWMKFITASYSGTLSLEHAEHNRDLIKSEKFRKYFPDLGIKYDKDSKSNFSIIKRVYTPGKDKASILIGGGRYSTSVGGTVTGFHAHIQIIDDPLNPKQAASEVELKNAIAFFDQTMSLRKIDKLITPRILIMQRLHQEDPTGHIISKPGCKIKHICLPGESRNYGDNIKPAELKSKYKDDLLDPERMSWAALEKAKSDLGQFGYAGQIGQLPTPPAGGMFKVDHLQVVYTLPLPEQILNYVRYWDKAGSEGKGCFTVGVKIHKLTNGKYLISDVKRGQWASEERERIIFETAQADGVDTYIYVEQEGGSGGKESAEATIRNLAGFMVYADHPTGNKSFRADPFSVQVNNGNVSILNADWNKVFIDELRFFPFSTYKDQVDAVAGAFSKAISVDFGI